MAGETFWQPIPSAAASLNHKLVNPTAGSTSINSASTWADLATYVASFSDITLTCSAGDVVEVGMSGLWQNQSTVGLLDVATIVSAAVVNYISSGTSTPSGVRAWYGHSSVWLSFGAGFRYTIQGSDVNEGTVTFRPRVQTNGAKTLFHDPAQFFVTVLGPAA